MDAVPPRIGARWHFRLYGKSLTFQPYSNRACLQNLCLIQAFFILALKLRRSSGLPKHSSSVRAGGLGEKQAELTFAMSRVHLAVMFFSPRLCIGWLTHWDLIRAGKQNSGTKDYGMN